MQRAASLIATALGAFGFSTHAAEVTSRSVKARNAGDGHEPRRISPLRAILIVPLAFAAILVAAPAGLANMPTREELPPAGDFTDVGCGFPMFVDFEEAQSAVVTSFFDENGNLVREIAVFPGDTVTITNLETGESMAQSLSGQGVKEFHPDGSTTLAAHGGWGLWTRAPGDLRRGRFITVGQLVEVRDADGRLVSRALDGRLIDVCAELAP